MMSAFSVVPPEVGKRTAAGTGFDSDIADLFINAGGSYNNKDLNARYGDRFYATPKSQEAPIMESAKAWQSYGLYSSFYSPSTPANWAVHQC